MVQVAPGNLVAMAMALFGLGLLVAAFLGDPPPTLRLGFGIGLLVLALLTSGAQLLFAHAARDEEET
jgi:ABC-type multidrug transport system permease subunit